MKKGRLREWFSIQLAKKPGRLVLAAILLFNVVFLLVSAVLLHRMSLALAATREMGFWEAVFYTLTMILDAGCVSFVIEEVGKASVLTAIVCLVIILVGMITFTGAVIGYITNYISSFIDSANAGYHRLLLRDHVVILNWNTRASEIVNDFLYSDRSKKIVVLVESQKAEVEREIRERLTDTVARENIALRKKAEGKKLSFFGKHRYIAKQKFRNRLSVFVREGDVFSTKQLNDISLAAASTVIILSNDLRNTVCRLEYRERQEVHEKGNALTIKSLIQVADITGADESKDNQKIVVEISDDWTLEQVRRIIKTKQVDGKCRIVPLCVNQILGQILSQFSLMPELNLAYKELFSNKGVAFFSRETEKVEDAEYIPKYLAEHIHAIPLTCMDTSSGKHHLYYSSKNEASIDRKAASFTPGDYSVRLHADYWMERKNIVILGHNSKCHDIMQGFCAFANEWNFKDGTNVIRIVVIDDAKHLEKMNYYREYPFVIKCVAADVYDRDLICTTIEEFVDQNEEDTSVLILSDDTVLHEDIDAQAMTNLIYVQDIITEKKRRNPDFDEESIDLIVEILDPKHHDVVSSYSVKNVVISNRYISKMITQIGEKQALFDFYNDILRYDDAESTSYDSKEIYVKKVSRFFDEVPAPCKADQLIRAVYAASTDPALPDELRNPAIVLGYVKPGGEMVLFSGNQTKIDVDLDIKDKLILFSNH